MSTPYAGSPFERLLHFAVTIAVERECEFLLPEHLLLALAHLPQGRNLLVGCGAVPARVAGAMRAYLSEYAAPAPSGPGGTPPPMPEPSPAWQRVWNSIQRRTAANKHGHENLGDVLAALLEEEDSYAALYLRDREDVTESDVYAAAYLGVSKSEADMFFGQEPPDALDEDDRPDDDAGTGDSAGWGDPAPSAPGAAPRAHSARRARRLPPVPGAEKDDEEAISPDDYFEGRDGSRSKTAPRRTALEKYATNLTALAREGKLDPLVGRAAELRRLKQVLGRRLKSNPVLLGDPGTGKTALVAGLAHSLAQAETRVPARLLAAEIFSLDVAGMLAGTRYRGDFEERLKQVLQELAERPAAIVFIDELHMISGAGTSGGRDQVDLANMLKPALSRGTLRCIGATTHDEYKRAIESDRALARRFQPIEVNEPSQAEAIEILQGLAHQYEAHHGVQFTAAALRAAVELTVRHLPERFLPDKAIDVLDEAGAAARLDASAAAPAPATEPPPPPAESPQPAPPEIVEIGKREIEAVVARLAKVPAPTMDADNRGRLRQLDAELGRRVFGQQPAIAAIARAIKRSRAGLSEPGRPIGSFLLAGPTGVGKTELARQCADLLGVHFARFDMSEYREPHAVARLIGPPPGYVGYERGGLLTDEIRRHPHCVLLLDEMEKAHPDMYNLLLQVMDHATLTDNAGRKSDFRHVLLLMTTNVGAREMAGTPLGFRVSATAEAGPGAREELPRGDGKRALEREFAPEFRNRLTAVLTFAPLDRAAMQGIVGKFIDQLQARLAARHVRLLLADEARAWLAERGYSPKFGARPLRRLIEEQLEVPLAETLLFGEAAAAAEAALEADAEPLWRQVQIDVAPDGESLGIHELAAATS